jgi:DNA ligase-1
MSTLPTIYKRTSAGKVQEWTIEIENDKYRAISGQSAGKKVISAWTTCKGKNIGKANATTGAEQATKEAEAKRRLKLEAEYRESVDDIDDPTIWKVPMLADEFRNDKTKKEVDIKYPVWVQPKLDGMRAIDEKEGVFSREGNPIVVAIHIHEELVVYLEKIEFDGELYNHEYKDDFDALISIAKKGKATPERLAVAKEKLQYHVYDIRDTTKIFSERYKILSEVVAAITAANPNTMIRLVDTRKVENRKELDDYYEEKLAEGYEGIMIRNDVNYHYDRTSDLLKRKEMITEDFDLIRVLEGKGNRGGMAGKFVFMKDGKEFEAGLRGGVIKYTEWWNNRENLEGKSKWTVRYQNLTPDGIPRFPVVVAQRNYE